jgi:diguanylate cyclase (GGDEF)-like protein
MTPATLLPPDELEASLAELPDHAPLALALADLDHFKELNDEHGHAAGDAVLAAFERTLAGNLPDGALVARISGDEYAVALPGAGPETALILLEEIRAHFSARPPAEEVPDPVAVSIGIASRPQHAKSSADLLRAAGEALFRAKREGKGRVAIYVEDKMTLKSNYYSKASLDRLGKLSAATHRTEASLLREALDDLLAKHKERL